MILHLIFYLVLVGAARTSPTSHPAKLRALCEIKFGDGWRGVIRNDGSIMCMKIFTNGNECLNYEETVDFCKQKGGFAAPVASKEEQELLVEILESVRDPSKANVKPMLYGVFLGAQKVGNLWATGKSAEFRWDYDGKKVEYNNFAISEPNNRNHNGYKGLPSHYEYCIEVSATAELGVWWDQSCLLQCRREAESHLGAVCAKPLREKKEYEACVTE